MSLDEHLLSILACPACKGDVTPTDEGEGLCCAACAKVYPIREEIPVMLVEESVSLAAWNQGQRGGNANPR